MNRLSRYHKLCASFSLLILLILMYDKVFAQKSKPGSVPNTIQNFQAREISDSELIVTVNYHYDQNQDTHNCAIFANPIDDNGTLGNDIIDDEVPLRHGNNTAILRLRIRPHSRNYTSTWIHVCMADADSAILCKDFPYTKKWSASQTPQTEPRISPDTRNPQPPSPPPHSQTAASCIISGKIRGQLSADIQSEPGGPTTLRRLKYVYIDAMDHSSSGRVRLDSHGNYSYKGVAGKRYKIYVIGFVTDPLFQTVNCQSNATHGRSLRILRPTPDD